MTWNDGTDEIVGLIPAYQEGPRIGAVVEAARRHVPVVVVDDGSTDDTAARAKAAGATVIRQVPNAGKGAALRMGFRHALDQGAAAVVTLDADGQHDPDEIPAFLLAFERSRPELVIGRRDFGEMPTVRRLSNVLGGVALSVALGRNVPDNQSGYRLIGRVLMRAMLDSDESGFEFEVEMIARCIALGLPLEWVPIRTIYGGEPSHIEPWRHLREFVRVTAKARRIARR
ncbi:MAG TPA: glycosyltransferase family 2 protein [Candidatus Limnocylindrales bacterium]|nr:glycosyltransferase family 2 protein [Candidatus Limnocylindrales bacterium]